MISDLSDKQGAFSPQHPLHTLSPTKAARLQLKGVKSAFRSTPQPKGSFVDLGNGIVMSSPELLFAEMANVMEPVVHLLLGMELCGRFSRDPVDPRNGSIVYDVDPATSIERLRAFAQDAPGIRGARKALHTIDQLVANAWSPMEALLAALLVLPDNELRYDLWPFALNPRKEASEHIMAYTHASSRVPDILFSGTSIGLNYDGEDHFGLWRIAETAAAAERDPGNGHLAEEAVRALADARQRIIADKRRDRDLEALGYVVMPVTKEDLQERGGLDRVIKQVIDAIEREGTRNLEAQRQMLEDESLTQMRQLFIWSLMPGASARGARERLKELLAKATHRIDNEHGDPEEAVDKTGAHDYEEPVGNCAAHRAMWAFARPLGGANLAPETRVVIEFWKDRAESLLLGDV